MSEESEEKEEDELGVWEVSDEVVNAELEGDFKTSTGFLERFFPLCMCLSQYFESGKASFEHLHFFPSVLLHLPGSGSIFLPRPI